MEGGLDLNLDSAHPPPQLNGVKGSGAKLVSVFKLADWPGHHVFGERARAVSIDTDDPESPAISLYHNP